MRGVRVSVAVGVVVVMASVLRADGLYSSFYAPLYEPRVLGYRVEAPFRPGDGGAARGRYRRLWGHRGERLVAALGAGGAARGWGDHHDNIYGDVTVYYTNSNNYNK